MAKSELLSSVSSIVVKNPRSEIQNPNRGVREQYVAGFVVRGRPKDGHIRGRSHAWGVMQYAGELTDAQAVGIRALQFWALLNLTPSWSQCRRPKRTLVSDLAIALQIPLYPVVQILLHGK